MKNKFSQFLDDYSNNLKRLGVYLVIVLFVFGLALNVMLNKDKMVENAMKDLPQVEITTEPSETETPAETATEQIQTTFTNKEPSATGDSPVVSDQEVDNSRSLAHSPTRPLSMVWPLKGEILTGYELQYSSTFGDYRLHPGLDIKAQIGSKVKAAASGKVALVEKFSAQGVVIQIEHENGYTTTYAHLEKALVEKGQPVQKEQEIGVIGQPGTEEDNLGPHLHFGIKQNEQTLDPIELLGEF